jgi:hypothetical protein
VVDEDDEEDGGFEEITNFERTLQCCRRHFGMWGSTAAAMDSDLRLFSCSLLLSDLHRYVLRVRACDRRALPLVPRRAHPCRS